MYGIVIPVYKKENLTNNLLDQIAGQTHHMYNTLVIDNAGDFALQNRHISSTTVISQDSNIGWLKACNLGMNWHFGDLKCEGVMLLNNDVILSDDFLKNLAQMMAIHGPAIIAPLYDDVWAHQKSNFNGPAKSFMPQKKIRSVDFVDGTCMFIHRKVYEEVGCLDSNNFGVRGWGADIDYCHRAQQKGFPTLVSHYAYLNHMRAQTVYALGQDDWFEQASSEMNAGMEFKYGPDWRSVVGVY